MIATLVVSLTLLPQEPAPREPGTGPRGWVPPEVHKTLQRSDEERERLKEKIERARRASVRYDERHRPVLPVGVEGAPGDEAGDEGTGDVTVRPLRSTGRMPGRDRGTGRAPGDGSSPLADVFGVVGGPEAFRELGGVSVWMRVRLMDERGAEIGHRDLVHEADLKHVRRDRVVYDDRLVYGRMDGAAFAERRVDQGTALPWPTMDDEAREDLEVLGLLLRAPWVFADEDAYEVRRRDPTDDAGRRLRIERRTAAGDRPELQFELRGPAGAAPAALRITGDELLERHVHLGDWRPVPGSVVHLPWKREMRDAEGRLLMVLEVLRVEVHRDHGEHRFRPSG